MSANPFDAQRFMQAVPHDPGVYTMYNAENEVLYVGKAKNLKKRLASYFSKNPIKRVEILMRQVQRIETTVTETENEALLLENNFIKQRKPRYNILLRDDKSYPYIVLSDHTDFPRLSFYRGPRTGKNHYYGPYPNIIAVRESLSLLQKIFRLRSCLDHFFRNRTRPCLQYQIKRCTAPCVGLITKTTYAQDVQRAILFLGGKSQQILGEIGEQMDKAAQAQDYEKAARYRDQISHLRQVQEQQVIDSSVGNRDVIAVTIEEGRYCLYRLEVREGRLLGGKAYFLQVPYSATEAEAIEAFLTQFYLQAEQITDIPREIIVSALLNEKEWLMKSLTSQAKRKVTIIDNPRGERLRSLEMAHKNAKQALASRLADKASIYERFITLQRVLNLENLPQRLECFDVSHNHGEATVAACVVFNTEGPKKSDYRRFNIENVTPGDDYAAMGQALLRRYSGLKANEGLLPDILVIDGGKGQMKQAQHVFEKLQITGVLILAIAKGAGRKAGLETIYVSGQKIPVDFPADSLALHLLQYLRDEAHRFAIVGHRIRRDKKRTISPLQEIPGIGPKRRRELLKRFGGLQELSRASVDEIAKVEHISKAIAERIYLALKDKN